MYIKRLTLDMIYDLIALVTPAQGALCIPLYFYFVSLMQATKPVLQCKNWSNDDRIYIHDYIRF